MLDYSSFEINKFVYNKEEVMTSESILSFMEKGRTKGIDAHYRSEELPTEKEREV